MTAEGRIPMIGRGESVLTNAEETARADKVDGDVEDNQEAVPLASNAASMGWLFPKVKLESWNPQDEKQWQAEGRSIARRNLVASIPNLTCGFGVWLVWSVIVAKIQLMHDQDKNVYPLQDWGSPEGSEYKKTLYLLPAVAGLSGGTLRIPNSFMTQVCGGRNVVWSTSLLLCVPMLLAGIALQSPNCPYNVLLVASLLSDVDRKSTRLNLQSHHDLVCRLLLEKKKKTKTKKKQK